MTIADIIGPAQVVVGLRASDKTHLLRELAGRAGQALSLDAQTIFDALQSREALGSTGFGKGFALPHARLEGLPNRFALFARLSRPIEFAAIDGQPVDLVILLLTPVGASNDHLATLAALARPFRDERFPRALRGAPDAWAAHRLLSGA
jgi:PTS system nitrogen regulatory IIA component